MAPESYSNCQNPTVLSECIRTIHSKADLYMDTHETLYSFRKMLYIIYLTRNSVFDGIILSPQ